MFKRKVQLTLLLLTLISVVTKAQINITGPACVKAGTSYQYSITGNLTTGSTMQVCVTGGVVIADNAVCTTNGAPISRVYISWNTNAATRSVAVTSSLGNATLNVQLAPEFKPGLIDSLAATQSIVYNGSPAAIGCGPANGGNCSPVYSYTWEKSLNGIQWTAISGATTQQLSFNTPLIATTYFRRKVIETVSGTIGYSNLAVVFVGPDMTGHN
jgi:hypothetical protein